MALILTILGIGFAFIVILMYVALKATGGDIKYDEEVWIDEQFKDHERLKENAE